MPMLKDILPKVEVNTYRKSNPMMAKVIETKSLYSTDNGDNQVKHIVLSLKEDFVYFEGQSVGIIPYIKDNQTDKPPAVRLYSISSMTNKDNHDKQLSICVKRVVYWDEVSQTKKRGLASNYLCDLQEGDSVTCTGPAGKLFLLPDNQYLNRPYIFFATGTGIAPFCGMLARLFHPKSIYDQQVCLFFGVKSKVELLYHEQFLAYKRDNFLYDVALSREQFNKDGTKFYVSDLIDKHSSTIKKLLENPETLIYICGLKGMQESITKNLLNLLNISDHSSDAAQTFIKNNILVEVY